MVREGVGKPVRLENFSSKSAFQFDADRMTPNAEFQVCRNWFEAMGWGK
jgi:hypothetical protein